MALALGPGDLTHVWVAKCVQCKREHILRGAVTRHGARMTLENGQWAESPRGWLCAECRSAPRAK